MDRCPLSRSSQPQRLVIDTGPDGVTRFEQVGWVTFGDPVGRRVALWWLDQYGGGLFLPLRDATAGTTSYGAGRYLLDTAKGADLGSAGQALVVDLNFHVPPVLPLRQPLGLPARAARQRHRRAHPGGRAADPAMSCQMGTDLLSRVEHHRPLITRQPRVAP